MPPPFPEKLPQTASWPVRSPDASPRVGRGTPQTIAIGALVLVACLVISAWAIPPMLDWGRYRVSIASIAGAELGRKVEIGGDVALRLFPQALLTATDVTLPDRGDGMSARVSSLRLEVALVPLLAGHLVLRDLVLGSPRTDIALATAWQHRQSGASAPAAVLRRACRERHASVRANRNCRDNRGYPWRAGIDPLAGDTCA